MKCSELMTPNPDFCVPDERLLDALKIMQARDVGAVPVVDSRMNMRPIGMVTDRDAALHLAARDLRPSEVRCREVMTSPAVTVRADDDVKEAFEKMRDRQLRRIVVEENGRLVGIIAQADVARQKPGDAKKVVEDVSQPGIGKVA